jgi:hypothetical protein
MPTPNGDREKWSMTGMKLLSAMLLVPLLIGCTSDLEEGIRSYEQGEMDKALADLYKVSDSEPDIAMAKEYIINIKMQLGNSTFNDGSGDVGHFRDVLERDPNHGAASASILRSEFRDLYKSAEKKGIGRGFVLDIDLLDDLQGRYRLIEESDPTYKLVRGYIDLVAKFTPSSEQQGHFQQVAEINHLMNSSDVVGPIRGTRFLDELRRKYNVENANKASIAGWIVRKGRDGDFEAARYGQSVYYGGEQFKLASVDGSEWNFLNRSITPAAIGPIVDGSVLRVDGTLVWNLGSGWFIDPTRVEKLDFAQLMEPAPMD